MKITNFRPHKTDPNLAYVDVEYPWWEFKAKQTKIIFKVDGYWRWLATGEWIPCDQILPSEKAYYAKKQLGINTNYRG